MLPDSQCALLISLTVFKKVAASSQTESHMVQQLFEMTLYVPLY